MRTIIAVGGEPATGKTTLFRKFMEPYSWETADRAKTVTTMYNQELDLHILGKYEPNEVFAGTDRLSMAVQPPMKEFVSSTNSNILFEGDRLFNSSFLEFLSELKDTKLKIIYISAHEDIKHERHKDRNDSQTDKFLQGRKTKYENILSSFVLMEYIEKYTNDTYEEQKQILDLIRKEFNIA